MNHSELMVVVMVRALMLVIRKARLLIKNVMRRGGGHDDSRETDKNDEDGMKARGDWRHRRADGFQTKASANAPDRVGTAHMCTNHRSAAFSRR